MIAKCVPMNNIKRSSFTGLVQYLVSGQGKAVRVGQVLVSNCYSDDPQWAALEVEATQTKNMRAESDKTYHLILSFPTGENPPPEVLKAIEERICKGLGYCEHQRVSVIHDDTDNLHVHLAINKIHPGRHTIYEPYRDHKKLAELCTGLEAEYGLERDNHTPKRTAGRSKAADIETAAGIESLIGWIQRECLSEIRSATSWSELHKSLWGHGLEIRERGNGLVIINPDGIGVKGSSVSRECSKKALEARLGKFEISAEAQVKEGTERRYAPKPMPTRVDTTELYSEYQAERNGKTDSRALEWKNAKEKKHRLIEDAKRASRLKRAAIKLATKGGAAKRLLYGLVSKSLKGEIAKINQEYMAERQAVFAKYRRYSWNDWLQEKARQGNANALDTLRARQVRANLKGDTLSSDKAPANHSGAIPGVRVDSVTKKGTIIYHFAGATIRDDGKLLKVSKGAGQEALEAALRMAVERFGKNLTVNGTLGFKEQVVRTAAAARLKIEFDDPDLERRRLDLLTGEDPPGSAAHKYIEERNRKRLIIADIAEHRPYTPMDAGDVIFRGLRQVEGVGLALLQKGEQILVLPVDHSTATRLQRLHLGDAVSVTAERTIQVQGRSRGR